MKLLFPSPFMKFYLFKGYDANVTSVEFSPELSRREIAQGAWKGMSLNGEQGSQGSSFPQLVSFSLKDLNTSSDKRQTHSPDSPKGLMSRDRHTAQIPQRVLTTSPARFGKLNLQGFCPLNPMQGLCSGVCKLLAKQDFLFSWQCFQLAHEGFLDITSPCKAIFWWLN